MILMKAKNDVVTGHSKTNVSLRKLIDDITKKSSASAPAKEIHITNNVSPEVYINTNEDVIASVIEGILNSVMTNAADGDIDISALQLFSNTIKLSVKDNNCYNTYAVACSLQKTVELSEHH